MAAASSAPSLRRGVLQGLLVASMVAGLIGPIATTANAAYSPTFQFTNDDGGVNQIDNNAGGQQSDMTRFGIDTGDLANGFLWITWNWDRVNFTSQTGDACAIFDTDGDGNANYSVCVQVSNTPIGGSIDATNSYTTTVAPFLFECTADSKTDRCGSPDPRPITTTDMLTLGLNTNTGTSTLVTNTDPFGAGEASPKDTTIVLKLATADLPPTAELLNVCSYPSAGSGGNNAPGDCIVLPGAAFLTIIKNTDRTTTDTFTFNLSPAATDGTTQFTHNGSGTVVDRKAVSPGAANSLAEVLPNSTWALDTASCVIGTTATGTLSGTTISSITFESGRETVCTFNNKTAIFAPDLTVTKTNDATRDAVFNDTETVPGTASYPYTVTYKVRIVNGGSTATVNSFTDVRAPNVGTGGLTLGADTTAPSGATACSAVTSLPNGATTCYYDVVYANANTAQVINTVNVSASNAAGSGSGSDTSTVNFTQSPTATIVKTVVSVKNSDDTTNSTGGKADEAGDIIHYSITYTNTGNQTLTGVSVSDPLLGTLDCTWPGTAGTLTPGQHVTCTGSYVVLQSDINNNGGGDGDIDNTATGDSNQTDPVSDSKAVLVVQSPTATIVKTVVSVKNSDDTTNSTGGKADEAGDIIHYSITYTNTGNQTLTGVSVSDPLLGTLDCTWPGTAGTLTPGQHVTCTGSYVVLQSDINNNGGGDGDIDNTATGDSNQTEPVSDSKAVLVVQSPTATIVKTVVSVKNSDDTTNSTGGKADEAGDIIHYSITYTNTGNQTLTGVSVSDPLLGTLDCTWPGTAGTLTPGQHVTCTGSYVVLQSDINNNGGGDGDIDNTATGDSNQTDPVSDSKAVLVVQSPTATIVKTVVSVKNSDDTTNSTGGKADEAGDIIHYSITYTNTGNQTLTGVSVSDPLLGTLDCTWPGTAGTLTPGQHVTCTGSYVVLQSDINNNGGGDGDIDNTATGDSNQTDPVSDSKAVLVVQSPTATIVKTVVSVKNSDDTTNSTGGKADEAGDIIHYSITYTNTGNQTLTGVSVSDPLLGTLDCTWPGTAGTLTPGQHVTCTGSYVVLQSDINNNGGGDGDIDNTATGDSNQTDPVSDSKAVLVVQSPTATIVKTVVSVKNSDDTTNSTGGKADEAGDIIHYSITYTNTGNQTLTGVSVSDPLLGTLDCTWPGTAGTLTPGQHVTCTGSYVVLQSDINNNGGGDGDIDNTATGDSNQTDPVSDSKAVLVVQSPTATIVKTVVSVKNSDDTTNSTGGKADEAGDIIHYSITYTNTGNQTLTGVSVSDPLLGTLDCTWPGTAGTLTPGQHVTCTGSYVVLQSDINNNGGGDGDIDNTATGDSNQTDPVSDSKAVLVVQSPTATIVKTVVSVKNSDDTTNSTGGKADEAGDIIHYSITYTNTGNQTLTGVSVSDPLLGTLDCTWPGTAGTLTPGQHVTCTGSYVVKQSDINNNGGGDGDIDNTATGSSDQTDPVSDSKAVLVVQSPTATIVKTVVSVKNSDDTTNSTGGKADEAGDIIHYSITYTNTGNQTLTGVSVSDPLLGTLDCTWPGTAGTLTPGQHVTCTGSYVVKQSDINNNGGGDGDIDNTATGSSDQTTPVSDSKAVLVVQSPHISLTKEASPTKYSTVGQVINYTLVATNDGNVTLHNVSISDPKLGTLTCIPVQPATLAAGGTLSCTGSYTIQASDVNAQATGSVVNTATVNGLGPQDQPVSAQATATVNQVAATGQIAPTATTCQQFKAGTAADLNQILYTVKGGLINSVAPGVLFYYSTVTIQPGTHTISVLETSSPSFTLFDIHQGQAVLYNANCVKLKSNATGSFTVTNSTTQAITYIIGIKYDPSAVVGKPKPAGDVTYTFSTYIDSVLVPTSPDSLVLKKKSTA